MSVHHDLRARITDALIASAGGFEDTATGRMIVANLDDLAMATAIAVKDIETRLGEAEEERAVSELREELNAWTG